MITILVESVQTGYLCILAWPPRSQDLAIDDSAKGGLTQWWEFFTMIPCAPKYLKR